MKPLSISIWSGQEQCRGTVCLCAHEWGQRDKSCLTAHTLSQKCVHAQVLFPPNTQKEAWTKDFRPVDSFCQSCFFHRSEAMVCSPFWYLWQQSGSTSGFCNKCTSPSHFCWGEFKVVYGIWDAVDESPLSGLLQLCPSFLFFFISGNKKKSFRELPNF